jgi:hypothetical protein
LYEDTLITASTDLSYHQNHHSATLAFHTLLYALHGHRIEQPLIKMPMNINAHLIHHPFVNPDE